MNGFKKQQQKFGRVGPLQPAMDFNPDIVITIAQESATGKTMLQVNKPVPVLLIAHLLSQAVVNNLTTAIQQQSMIVDPNGKGIQIPINEEKQPTHEYLNSQETGLCELCGLAITEDVHYHNPTEDVQ